ncbi:DUF1631 family protein [Guyparkeria sp.]|uniref:DUF1631 family protein n=1 Tax=Guyparkeria sp. TaxID=2035736 RepID=UPI003563E037
MMNRNRTRPVEARRELARLMESPLDEGIKRLFAHVERELFDEAAEQDGETRAELFQAVAFNRARKDAFLRDFKARLLQPPDEFDREWHVLTGDRASGVRVEDALARAHELCDTEHTQFEARIRQLHSDDPEATQADLYTLEAITRVFLGSIRDFPSSLKTRLIEGWPERTLFALAPVYAVLNDYLVHAGVLPGIKRLRDESTDVPRPRARPAAEPAKTTPAAPKTVKPGPSIQELTERLAPMVRTTMDGDDRHLYRFQRDADWRAEDFTLFVMDQVDPSRPRSSWLPKTRELIRLVGVTLSDVLNDPVINARHRRLVAELQLAVLYFAAGNRHFFSDADHPLRHIINLIALVGSDPDLNRETGPVEALLRPIQEAILENPDQLDLIARQLHDFSHGKAEQVAENEVAPARNRLVQVEQRCRLRVEKMLAAQTKDLPIQKPTYTLLEKFFTPFMVRTMINQGRQSAGWNGVVGLLEEALTLQMDPTIEPQDVTALEDRIATLFDAPYTEGLQNKERKVLDTFVAYLRHQSEKAIPMPTPRKAALDAPVDDDHADTTESIVEPDGTENASVFDTDSPVNDTSGKAAADTPADTTEVTDEPESNDKTAARTGKEDEGELPEAEGTASSDAGQDLRETDEEASDAESRIPQDGLVLASMEGVQAFFRHQIRGEEWFEVHTGPGRALRRLKMLNLDEENGVLNFANRTGQIKLTLPVAQVIEDLLDDRTRPVFENPRYSQALERLREQLEEQGNDN